MKLMYLLLSTVLFSLMMDSPFDFDKAWKEAQEAMDSGRPKDALDLALNIYQQAETENNQIQKTKAIVFIAGIKLNVEENAGIEIQKFLKNEILKSKPPFKNILHAQYAGFLDNYFNNNRYQISQRTETIDDLNLLTMTNQGFYNEISLHYKESMTQPQELQISVNEYKALLNEYNEEGKAIFPTLYEVLANRALNYYTKHGEDIPNITYHYLINDENFFNAAEDFSNRKFNIGTETSNVAKAIVIYQDILRLEIDKKRINTLAYFDLKRLQFVYNHATLNNKDDLYIKALKNGMAIYGQYPSASYFHSRYVNFLYQKNDPSLYTEIVGLCENAIKKYPKSEGAQECQNVLDAIKAVLVEVKTELAIDDKSDVKYKLKTRNVNHVFLKLVETPDDLNEYMYIDGVDNSKALLEKAKIVKSWSEKISSEPYIEKSSLFNLSKLPLGSYTLIVSDTKDYSKVYNYISFRVTNLSYIHYVDNSKGIFLIVNRQTGKPIKGAKVEIYESDYDYQQRKNVKLKIGEFISDNEGKVACNSNNKNISVKVIFGKDTFKDLNQHYIYKREEINYTRESNEIYTDRAIYRPGQTVYFKVLSLTYNNNNKPTINKNHPVKLNLYDGNGQLVNSLSLITNDFGSASGSFILPNGRLTGQFSIQSDFGYKVIRVEEYKRPTFEVLIDTIKTAIKLGDVINISGKAKSFSGVAITGGEVKYEVYRQTILPWCYRWYPISNNNEFLKSGSTQTDDQGEFKFDFSALYEEKIDVWPIYRYQVKVSVLDGTGEKRETEYFISLSQKSLFLETNIPAFFDVSSTQDFEIIAKNQNNEIVNTKGSYTIYKLVEPKLNERVEFLNEEEEGFLSRKIKAEQKSKFDTWAVEKVMVTESFTSNLKFSLKKLPHGVYKIEAVDKDKKGDLLKSFFIISDHKNKKFPKGEKLYVKADKNTYSLGEVANISIGTSDKNEKHIFIVLSKGNKVIKGSWHKLKNGMNYTYKLTNDDIEGLKLSYAYVENNRYYEGHEFIKVEDTNKDLLINFETFRDKLLPGEQVEYKIKISGKDKDKIYSEVLAAMYDASLDIFEKNSWQYNFKNEVYHDFGFQGVMFGLNYGRNVSDIYDGSKQLDITIPILPDLFGYFNDYGYYSRDNYESSVMYTTSAAPTSVKSKANGVVSQQADEKVVSEEAAAGDASASSNTEISKVVPSPRKNLNETVFFYPHFKTDAEGNIILSFKMNEALTRWRLMLLAHNQNLATVFSEKLIETKKDLMIVANNPRFLRDDDELWFTARASNLTNKPLIAKATMKFFDGVSEA
ncbi:MAG: hypothetical protein RLZZ546_2389, partial [Bacteroidota bacterium]